MNGIDFLTRGIRPLSPAELSAGQRHSCHIHDASAVQKPQKQSQGQMRTHSTAEHHASIDDPQPHEAQRDVIELSAILSPPPTTLARPSPSPQKAPTNASINLAHTPVSASSRPGPRKPLRSPSPFQKEPNCERYAYGLALAHEKRLGFLTLAEAGEGCADGLLRGGCVCVFGRRRAGAFALTWWYFFISYVQGKIGRVALCTAWAFCASRPCHLPRVGG